MKSSVWIAFVVLSASSWCLGEIRPGSQTLSLSAGGGFSGSEFDQQVSNDPNKREKVADPGGAFGGQYVYFLRSGPTVGIGVDILKSALREHHSDALLTDFKTDTRFQPTTVLALAKVVFGQGRVHPYLFGGIGFHRTSYTWDLEPKGPAGWSDTGTLERRRMIDDTATGFAGAGGIGMDIFLTPSLFIGAEGRGTYLGSAVYRLTSQARAIGLAGDPRGDFVSFNLLGRVGIKFGS